MGTSLNAFAMARVGSAIPCRCNAMARVGSAIPCRCVLSLLMVVRLHEYISNSATLPTLKQHANAQPLHRSTAASFHRSTATSFHRCNRAYRLEDCQSGGWRVYSAGCEAVRVGLACPGRGHRLHCSPRWSCWRRQEKEAQTCHLVPSAHDGSRL